MINPFFQQVVASVGESQDGGKLNPNDEYGNFLLTLIKANTNDNPLDDEGGRVDVAELSSNLRYAIHEFGKALKEVERFFY